jgi:hypothetical protein
MFAVDAKKIAEKFTRHGGAFDRGSADSYYHMAGYEYNEAHGDKKDWG